MRPRRITPIIGTSRAGRRHTAGISTLCPCTPSCVARASRGEPGASAPLEAEGAPCGARAAAAARGEALAAGRCRRAIARGSLSATISPLMMRTIFVARGVCGVPRYGIREFLFLCRRAKKNQINIFWCVWLLQGERCIYPSRSYPEQARSQCFCAAQLAAADVARIVESCAVEGVAACALCVPDSPLSECPR